MLNRRSRPDYRIHFRRKQILRTAFLVIFSALLLLLVPVLFMRFFYSRKTEREAFQELWESSAYEKIYKESLNKLSQNPLDFFLLTLRGFSSYQLAIAQINSFDTLYYIDDCIWSLRKALLLPEGKEDGRLYYVLGKAYFEKGNSYADLAVKYLEKSRELDFDADDIPQYLGLSYAAIQDFRSSVAAFSLALNNLNSKESDTLLLAIANSYQALGEIDSAQAYLYRCLETSRDSNSVINARLRLGEIFALKGDKSGAETQFRNILADIGENADAHFYLGELYASNGESTRARAEWRNAVRIDPAHRQARARLN